MIFVYFDCSVLVFWGRSLLCFWGRAHGCASDIAEVTAEGQDIIDSIDLILYEDVEVLVAQKRNAHDIKMPYLVLHFFDLLIMLTIMCFML
jgi:hypothetical protein